MSDDETRQLFQKVNEMHLAIVGNPSMGQKGLAVRVDKLEEQQVAVDKKLLTWSGIITGAGLVLQLLKDKISGQG